MPPVSWGLRTGAYKRFRNNSSHLVEWWLRHSSRRKAEVICYKGLLGKTFGQCEYSPGSLKKKQGQEAIPTSFLLPPQVPCHFGNRVILLVDNIAVLLESLEFTCFSRGHLLIGPASLLFLFHWALLVARRRESSKVISPHYHSCPRPP